MIELPMQVVYLETPFLATLLIKSNVDSVVEGLALRIPEQPQAGANGLAVEVRKLLTHVMQPSLSAMM